MSEVTVYFFIFYDFLDLIDRLPMALGSQARTVFPEETDQFVKGFVQRVGKVGRCAAGS